MDLFQKITTKTTLLTPNRRLAAIILKKYSQWQIDQKHTCWKTLDILPLYPSWLERLWKEYSAREITENSILLTTHQEQILWEKILRDAPENESLLQISDTAKLAKSAWETLKRWRVNINDSSLKLTEDSRAFFEWATCFQKLLQKKNWVDQNSLADSIAEKIATKKIIPPQHIILIGFTEIAPQYQYLLKTCEEAGTQIDYQEMPLHNQTTHCIGLTDTETEIQTMARWAKSLSNHSKSIACIIPNLESEREQVLQIFSDVFGDRQFNISAGKSLNTYPIIHDALELLKLNKQTISIDALSCILRSPFVGAAERERNKRALFDNRLRNANINAITLKQLINPEEKFNLTNSCPELAKRIANFLSALDNTKKTLHISEWVGIFTDLLSQLGWPGERSLNSQEYQVVQHSWLPLLSEYASFDNILEPINYHAALHYLTCLASSTVFQPESPETSVQILGLLEAAEIPFEYSWIMGLDDATWPSKPKPNPFIPLRLQKALSMPNASADRELAYCQQLTKQLQHSSQYVIFSHPLKLDDAELRPSALLKEFSGITLDQVPLSEYISPAEKIYHTRNIEFLADEIAPIVSETEEIRGGVSIFKAQAECPFKAFAEHRLHAKKIEETSIGLRNLDRGNLVHKGLELLWKKLKDSNTLMMKPETELRELINQCANQALNEVIHLNEEEKTRYLALEIQRLEKLLWDWLQLEKQRPPFTVVAHEKETTVTLGKITANLRIDRIDELKEGGQLIIDYKTGKYLSYNDWFGNRLDEPQLPLYSIINQDETIGIAFAKVNPNEMEMLGVSKQPLKMKSIKILAELKQADATLWGEQTQLWHSTLVKLGEDFYQGHAQVDPKDSIKTCRLCALRPICRIHEIENIDNEYEE